MDEAVSVQLIASNEEFLLARELRECESVAVGCGGETD
jgi:hypothetical protein